mgnify:CR=1 FL=1
MPRITKVYTRTGDDGTTGLGGGQRVEKDSLRIEAYGTVDELNSVLGVAQVYCEDKQITKWLLEIQNDLFHLGSDLCVLEEDKQKYSIPQIEKRHVDRLETIMDQCQAELAPLKEFILPGGSSGAAQLHIARTVCRRAERITLSLSKISAVSSNVIPYLNRLSDALFVLARYENLKGEVSDIFWNPSA